MSFPATKRVCWCSQPPSITSFGSVLALVRQRHEHGLGHILRRFRIPADQPERSRIDQVNVAADEFPEGGFRPGPCVL